MNFLVEGIAFQSEQEVEVVAKRIALRYNRPVKVENLWSGECYWVTPSNNKINYYSQTQPQTNQLDIFV